MVAARPVSGVHVRKECSWSPDVIWRSMINLIHYIQVDAGVECITYVCSERQCFNKVRNTNIRGGKRRDDESESLESIISVASSVSQKTN